MFDLNMSVDYNRKADRTDAQHSPATSLSSAVGGGGETSSSNDDAYTPCAASPGGVTLNFEIIGGGGGYGETDPVDRDRGLVTRELFPVSRLGELNLGKRISEPVSPHGPSRMAVQPQQQEVQQVKARKSRRGPRSRSSQYRGVTFYRRTGRWESHIWDCGKQVYLGGFDTALAAARAYDRAAIKFRGVDADINFNLSDYNEDMKHTKNLSKEEFVHILRRQSNGFSRGSSKYRGVTLHKCGRWEARMGQFLGKKAYDKAAIKSNGREAVTNFESSSYDGETIPEPRNGTDLDLNLGISTSSPKETVNFQFYPYDARNANMFKLQVEGSAVTGAGEPPLKGLQVTSQHPMGLASSEEVVKWAWGMNDQIRPAPVTVTAASSGFSSTAPYPTALNFCFSSHPTASQYHHH